MNDMVKKINDKAFSVIELMAGIVIIALTIVMICVFYSYMIKLSSKGLDVSIGTSVAEKVFDELANQRNSELYKSLIVSQSSGFVKTGNEIVGDDVYFYILEVVPSGDTTVSNSKLMQADIVVFWWNSPDMKNDIETLNKDTAVKFQSIDDFLQSNKRSDIERNEMGKMYIRLTRLVMLPE